jgi:hypothetical protein
LIVQSRRGAEFFTSKFSAALREITFKTAS